MPFAWSRWRLLVRPLADLAVKMRREETYHLLHFDLWLRRLAEGGEESHARLAAAIEQLLPDAQTVFAPLPAEDTLVASGILPEPLETLRVRWLERVMPRLEARRAASVGARRCARARRTHATHRRLCLAARRVHHGCRLGGWSDVVAAAASREAVVWAALAEIPDPEIPAISLVDLGVIGAVSFERSSSDRERLSVELLPTFVGCPAIEVMRQQIGERLRDLGLADEVVVEVDYAVPWTSDRITLAGREALRSSGFAPPQRIGSSFAGEMLPVLPIATCPYCASRNTSLENPFGPTLCRAIYHCGDCRQPFEAFKAI